MKDEPRLEELRQLCLDAASHRATGVVAGNRASMRWLAAVKRLLESPGGADVLKELLADPHPEVRLCAAGALLAVLPEQATPVLEELRAGEGFVAFEAKWALREHQRGAGSQQASPDVDLGPPAREPIRSAVSPSAADDHLREVVARFHSSVMSLGLGQAGLERKGHLDEVADAYHALGLGPAAVVIRRTEELLASAGRDRGEIYTTSEWEQIEDLDRTYNALFPNDAALLDRILNR